MQDTIAALVSVGIVEALEMIEIEDQKRRRPMLSAAARQLATAPRRTWPSAKTMRKRRGSG
jgi:hypothetical protein